MNMYIKIFVDPMATKKHNISMIIFITKHFIPIQQDIWNIIICIMMFIYHNRKNIILHIIFVIFDNLKLYEYGMIC